MLHLPTTTLAVFALLLAATLHAAEPDFSGFPEINQHRPGERSLEVITSDGVPGLVRPTWTRCISELGRNPKLFRYRDEIFIVFSHLDGHRNMRFEATGECRVLVSKDEGKSWQALPPQPADQQDFEFVTKGDRLFRYEFVDRKQTHVRTSDDGRTWSERRPVYKPPFWLWGAMYDPASELFWCPAHAIPGTGTGKEREIHLVKSADGIEWEFVDQVVPYDNASESILRFDEDRTMTVVIRRKFGKELTVAVGKPPYTEWDLSTRPIIAEGEHFFEIGGRTFMASRALYRGKDERVLANPKIYDGRKAYSLIYRVTPDRQFETWATMDSMGDCSYPCLLEAGDGILCLYYSQHEDKVSKIFLCRYEREAFQKGPQE